MIKHNTKNENIFLKKRFILFYYNIVRGSKNKAFGGNNICICNFTLDKNFSADTINLCLEAKR